MRFRSIAVVTLLSFSALGSAQAQGASAHPSCTSVTADACQQAVDLFNYMAPQLGTAITGGNMTLAQGGSLGGRRLGLVPHFTIGVRANLVMGNVPTLQTPVATGVGATSPPAARAFETSTGVIPMPAVDASIGVFKGFPLALTNVGGVDLLLSAAYVPEVNKDNVTVSPDTPLKFGYGVRVGLLQESLLVPGVGISYMIRDLPKTTITGTAGSTTLNVKDVDLGTTSWRITASKSLLLFGVALGAGQDTYDASTSISITPPSPIPATTPFNLSQKVTRTNYFADVSMNILLIKLVGSIGMVSGGDITTYNTFDPAPDKSRVYGSAGIRFGF